MSPSSARTTPAPAATATATRVATTLGAAIAAERRRRRWTVKELATRARVTRSTVANIEAGRISSLETYARAITAVGLELDLVVGRRREAHRGPQADLVHAAMGEFEARLLTPHGYRVVIDHPYRHYQFAGRADVLAWSADRRAMLHIENRTRFPNLQEAAGSFNAKCQYLAPVLARQMELRPS